MKKGLAIVFFYMIFTLTACTQKEKAEDYLNNPTMSNLPSSQRALLADIQNSGIQVVKQGMQFTFVIPTDCFFVKTTRELKTHREKDLDHLAQFINRYSYYFAKPTVKISGNTDKVWLAPARDKLSLRYAKTIAEYLREDGVNPAIILVRGEGAKLPVASNRYPMAASFNRRVVIVVG